MNRRSGIRCLATGAVVLAVCLHPDGAAAQSRLDISPVIGAYLSFSSFVTPDKGPFDHPTSLSQSTAVALGAQATWWPSPGFGIRAFAVTGASEVGPTDRNIFTSRVPEPARVTVAGGEALVTVSRLETGTTVFLSGGAALVRRSGDFYDGHDGVSNVGATLGVGSYWPVSSRLSLQADGRVLVYGLGLTDQDGDAYERGTQADLVAHVGVVIHLGGEVR